MKSLKNKITAVLVCLASLIMFSCSGMVLGLMTTKTSLSIASSSSERVIDTNGIVEIAVSDNIDETYIPTAEYTLPDGTVVKVPGTIKIGDNDKRILVFDFTPVPENLPGGTVNIKISVTGYNDTKTSVSFIPQATVSVVYDDAEFASGETVEIYDDNGKLVKPTIKTNYHDNIDIVEYYTDEHGNPIRDYDGDGDADWKDVQTYFEKVGSGKKISATYTATPNPDTDPSNGTVSTFLYEITTKPSLNIKDATIEPDSNIVTVTVDNDISTSSNPVIIYTKPDGTNVEREGKVREENGKKQLVFDLDPIDDTVRGGKLPVKVKVPGFRTGGTNVDYIPPVETHISLGGTSIDDGDDFVVYDEDVDTIEKPVITTNYTDSSIVIKEVYKDENGKEIGDWSKVRQYIKKNMGKRVTAIITATPKPDSNPSSAETVTFTVIKSTLPTLPVTETDLTNPGNVLTVEVDEDIPETPKPTATYIKPDGTKVEVEGDVTEDENGKKEVIFNLKPIDPTVPGGKLPVVITVPGHQPTTTEVPYIPQVEIYVTDKDGNPVTANEEIEIFDEDIDDFEKPLITTNYNDDSIEIKETYTDKDGNPVGDLETYIKNPSNKGKPVTVKVTATPKPDTVPSMGTEFTYKVKYTDKPTLDIDEEHTEISNPGNVITVVVENGDKPIPTSPKPTVTYTYVKPDGTEGEETVEGDVIDNGDGTTTVTFNANPINSNVPGGKLPIVVEVPGYQPAKPQVDYIPPVVITVKPVGSEPGSGTNIPDGGTVELTDADLETLTEPEVITNYDEDSINISKKYTYEDENGDEKEVGDLNGDGKKDFDDVIKFLEEKDTNGKPKNEGKPVTITVTATPDADPTSEETVSYDVVLNPKLPIASSPKPNMTNPGNVITVVVENGDKPLPTSPKPTVTYTYIKPDGTKEEITVEGTLEDNGDGTTTITFNVAPVQPAPPKQGFVPGGILPVTIDVPGYQPVETEVDYIPPVIITLNVDGDVLEDGDEITIGSEEIEDLDEPTIGTNYNDDAEVTIGTSYKDEDGHPLEDQDGDDDVDWEDVKKYLKDHEDNGGEVDVIITATPNPDANPTSASTSTFTLKTKMNVQIEITVETAMFTIVSSTSGNETTFTVQSTLEGALTYHWYVDDVEQSGVTANTFVLDRTKFISGTHTVKVTTITAGNVPYEAKANIKW